MLFSEAYVLAQMEEFNLAIEIFSKCKAKCNPRTYSTKEKYGKQRINILVGLCNAYYKLGNSEEAQKYANDILKLDSANEFVLLKKAILISGISSGRNVSDMCTSVGQNISFLRKYWLLWRSLCNFSYLLI